MHTDWNLRLLVATITLGVSTTAWATPIDIDPADFEGLYSLNFDGVFVSGPTSPDLAPGTYTLNPGGTGRVKFTVDASGEVSLGPDFDGISALGSSGTLDLLTLPVLVDPGSYQGNWEITRVRDSNPGAEIVPLVPSENLNFSGDIGNEHRLAIGVASSALIFSLRADGSMAIRGGDNATPDAVFDDGGTLRFNNTQVSVSDRDGSNAAWSIRLVSSPTTGDDDLILVPGVEYIFQANGDSELFTVAAPCAISPATLDMNGAVFELGCGVPDQDEDGVPDSGDNCPGTPNPDQVDLDQDGAGDACDADDDNDGIDDPVDNCPMDANPGQQDGDGDGVGDACDGDSDGDGVANEDDLCPLSPPSLTVGSDGCTGGERIARLCRQDDFVQHGQYVSCVADAASEAAALGLISNNEKGRFVREAARSK